VVGVPLGKCGDAGGGAVRRALPQFTNDRGTVERWQQSKLPAWEVPKQALTWARRR
jgi:hypothetical protein